MFPHFFRQFFEKLGLFCHHLGANLEGANDGLHGVDSVDGVGVKAIAAKTVVADIVDG